MNILYVMKKSKKNTIIDVKSNQLNSIQHKNFFLKRIEHLVQHTNLQCCSMGLDKKYTIYKVIPVLHTCVCPTRFTKWLKSTAPTLLVTFKIYQLAYLENRRSFQTLQLPVQITCGPEADILTRLMIEHLFDNIIIHDS